MAEPVYTSPEVVAKPLGPYSHLSRSGDLVYVAGQVGFRPDGTLAGDDIASQSRQTFANIGALLESQGGSLRSVLKFTTYLVSVDDIEGFYAVRNEIFPDLYPDGEYPPNTLLVVQRLVKPELLVEIEAVAQVGAA
jgi:enamine deaminase RidA (YjgF/YER057c/UK114 family)